MTQDPYDLATKDPITGLKNRFALETGIDELLLQARRDSELACLLMIDIEHFKQYVERFGSQQGNQALRSVALYLRNLENISEIDLVGRLDGRDRFVAFWTAKPEEESRLSKLAEMVQAELGELPILKYQEEPTLPDGYQRVSVNAALLFYYTDDEDVHAKAGKLIDRAGVAIDEMKQEGRSFSSAKILKLS